MCFPPRKFWSKIQAQNYRIRHGLPRGVQAGFFNIEDWALLGSDAHLAKPLSLDDCIRVAMTNNYDVRSAELDRQLGLNENDFTWITSRIRDVANRHAKGRIVSLLEGGYHLDALARSVEAHVRVLADL